MFDQGIDDRNVDTFLDGVDLYVDGLDFFAFQARKAVFDACARRKVPATTVAPLGMGAALLNFLPGQMTFEEYFRWDGCSEDEMGLRFFVGLAPARLQQGYLVDPTTIDFHARKGPSTAMGCQLCAGVAASEALKILLKRGKVVAAPRGVHFDAYSQQGGHDVAARRKRQSVAAAGDRHRSTQARYRTAALNGNDCMPRSPVARWLRRIAAFGLVSSGVDNIYSSHVRVWASDYKHMKNKGYNSRHAACFEWTDGRSRRRRHSSWNISRRGHAHEEITSGRFYRRGDGPRRQPECIGGFVCVCVQQLFSLVITSSGGIQPSSSVFELSQQGSLTGFAGRVTRSNLRPALLRSTLTTPT